MAKKDKREKRRAQRMRQRQRVQQKQTLLENKQDEELEDEVILDEDIELVDDIDSEDEEPEATQKDYYSSGPMPMVMPGPTSWEEHDAMQIAREKAEQVREVSYTTRDLVDNIIYSHMPPEEKARRIKAVGGEFEKRLKKLDGEKMEKEIPYDMELLEAQAMIAKEARSVHLAEKISDWVSKAKLTSAAEEKLSNDDFALVVERDGKTIRKYPIHNKAHVRYALSRATQMIEQGGEESEDARVALPNIKTVAKKMGIGISRNSIIVEKDLAGKWRAILVPSNNFIDRDGEILSEKAHEEYVDWVNKNMDCAPVFVTWHKPGTARESAVDYVGYQNGFLVESCQLTEKEAANLLIMQTKIDIGMSHGTIVLERDPLDENVITKYRMVECSDLPLKNAANPFTSLAVIMKEAGMNMDMKTYLTGMLGPERAEKFLAKTTEAQEALRDAGVKEKEDKSDSKPAESATPEATPATQLVLDQKTLEALSKEFGLKELSDFVTQATEELKKIPLLEGVIKELMVSEDQKLAEMIAPRTGLQLAWKERPSASSENVIDEKKPEDKKLKKEVSPELGWLSQATNSTPVQAETH